MFLQGRRATGVGGRAVGRRRAEGYASQARHGPELGADKIEKAMQAAFDKAVEEGVSIPKGLNERGQTIYRSNFYRARHG
jgi:hypothetical protein